jgi:hypothetical protein
MISKVVISNMKMLQYLPYDDESKLKGLGRMWREEHGPVHANGHLILMGDASSCQLIDGRTFMVVGTDWDEAWLRMAAVTPQELEAWEEIEWERIRNRDTIFEDALSDHFRRGGTIHNYSSANLPN